MARYLVTGGCGFIGSHLVEALLARGEAVVVVDDLSSGKRANLPPDVPLLVGDINDPGLLRQAIAGVDGCFHLAAIASTVRSNQEWLATHRVNLTGTIAVLEAARGAGSRAPLPVVYASSAAVYGNCDTPPFGEGTPCRPLTAYGADKAACELHARVGGVVHHIPSIGLRFFNVYGPRQDPSSPYSGVISIFMERIAHRQGITIFGDGEQVRDFIYVTDVVNFLLRAMERHSDSPRVYNVCTGVGTSLNRLAATIFQVTGERVAITRAPPRVGDIVVSVGDPALARARLGISAATPLETGLQRMLDGNNP